MNSIRETLWNYQKHQKPWISDWWLVQAIHEINGIGENGNGLKEIQVTISSMNVIEYYESCEDVLGNTIWVLRDEGNTTPRPRGEANRQEW